MKIKAKIFSSIPYQFPYLDTDGVCTFNPLAYESKMLRCLASNP